MTYPFDDLWRRVEMQESGGNQLAVSPVGAEGVAQLMPGTMRDPGFGVRPYNVNAPDAETENRRLGQDYLKAMIERYGGDTARALVAYNWGPGNADKWDGSKSTLPGETQNYLDKILGQGGYLSTDASKPSTLSNYAASPAQEPGEFDSILAELPGLTGKPQATQPQQTALAPPTLSPIRASLPGYL